MPALNYTTVRRILDQEPMLDDATLISSAGIYSYAEDAEAKIHGVLAARFTVPISGSPPLLQAVATKLAIGLILAERIYTQERKEKSEWVSHFLDTSMETLKSIADGKMTLVNSAGTVVGARNDLSELWSNTMTYVPTHDELDPQLHRIDPDKVDDLETSRELFPSTYVE